MNSLIKLELKRIISNKVVKVAVCICVLYTVVMLIGGFYFYEYFKLNEKTNTIEKVNGLKAVKIEKKIKNTNKGFLDTKKIKKAIHYYAELMEDKNNLNQNEKELSDYAWFKYFQSFGDIPNLIRMSYSDINKFDYYIINKLNIDDADQFYKNRINKSESYLNNNMDSLKINQQDKTNIITALKTLDTPLYYEYYEGWSKLLKNFLYINIILILIICFSISIEFSTDFDNGMILIILPTIHGKSKLILARIKACIIFSMLIYFLINIFSVVLFLSFYGYSGWNSAIQIDNNYWYSVYNLKFYQAYIVGFAIGFCICTFMALLTLLFVNIFKKAVLASTISIVLLLAPIFISSRNKSYTIAGIIELLPIKALNFSFIMRQQTFYNIIGFSIQRCYFILIFFLLFSLILTPFIGRIYRHLEV